MTAALHSRARGSRGGFTLVELLVTVLIIAILIGLTLTVIPRVRRAAAGASTSAQMTALATSIQAYYNDFRAYPGPLPNGQLGANYYASPVLPYVLDPNNGNKPLAMTFVNCDSGATNAPGQITGAENLVLGLLGGLEFTYPANSSTGTPITTFDYNPALIFPDGTTPAPLGPLVLNPNAPKRLGAYIQVKAGDLSNSRTTGTTPVPTVYTDEASRPATDSPIPEFVDKFSSPMPILYMRANVGAIGVVSYGQTDESGTALTAAYQYDLAQILGYTTSAIGTHPNNAALAHNGLQDIMPSGSATNPTPDTVAGDWSQAGPKSAGGGANAFAYLKDPSTPPLQSDNTTPTTNKTARPRQKDAFILVSPGPDGIYGTADDIIYPGGSVVSQ